MAASNLRNALTNAGLSADEFADIVRVDPKTVGRWLTGASTPYPRHRATISRALDLPEHELWPEHTQPPTTDNDVEDEGGGNDVTGSWPFLNDPDTPDPLELITGSDGQIDLLDNNLGIEIGQPLIELLVEQADQGRQVRVSTAHPTRRMAPLIGHKNIAVRAGQQPDYSILRSGDTLLFMLSIFPIGEGSPLLLQVQRTAGGGVFDRLTDLFQDHWDNTDNALTDPTQIEQYRTNTDEDIEAETEYEHERRQQPEQAHHGPSTEAKQPPPDASSTTAEPPRRWPGRPA